MIEKISQRESERDAALLDLQHSKESFKNISEASFDSIILTDAKGLIIYWNKAAQRIFGYKPNDIINESIGILLPERLRAKFYASFDTLQKKGEWRFIGKLFEFVGYSKRGYEFPIELTISKVGHGESLSLSFTIKDISQRKEYERSLIEARNKAEESDKLKSAFLANMSHEIRTPMNSIIGFSELLGKPNIREEEKNKFINYIISSGKSLLNLIDDIIDISKIEAGQLKINKVSVNVNSLLSEIFASFYENPKVKKNNFDLVLKREFNDHKFSLLTDPYRIKQILINLLTNAFKFTDEGSIEFGYRVCNTEFVEFYVKDTGVGIPVGKQDIIFDRFGQIEDTYFKNQGGTGLGLGISKKLTEMLGGKMWVESDSGQGATFYFTLPYTTSTGVRMLPPQKSSGKIKESWFHKTVLIAEDEESNFMFLEELLKPTGIGILHAKNGREAIEFVKEKTEIDIVLMDIKMPEMDGYQATRIIKTINNNLPVIAQTAYAMADEEQKTYAAGCDGYITKPISFTTLLDMMERLMQK
jgi:PAS domain S-box-containing protein